MLGVDVCPVLSHSRVQKQENLQRTLGGTPHRDYKRVIYGNGIRSPQGSLLKSLDSTLPRLFET